MSRLSISKYLNHLADIRRASGTNRESAVSEAFKDLLKDYARAHDLVFLNQHELPRQDGQRRIVDGALVYDLRLPFGYWEAKDEADDLDAEIAAKFRRGYPRDNIVFEDSRTAVLIQNGNEVTRCSVEDEARLAHLLDLFFAYERPEIAQFRKAVVQFQTDLPEVLAALRGMIERAQKDNAPFRRAAAKFLKHAQETINPAVTAEDVREMLIQHILTEEIFAKVFDEDDFHRQNNVAKELYALENLFFTGALKKNTLKGLEPYYNAIRATAHQIKTHGEKQTFLKVIYEGFYKVYNKKAADRLGVVYTPQEIVRFMVESADWLCQKHFGRSLVDRGVEILDPATGTGTFICELLEHFRGQKTKLAHKYKEELHANEVAILPYYVANLNIEATYAAITGQYAEFPNLCFVDTLDNVAGLGVKHGQHVGDLFGAMSEENVARIKRQNGRKISVVIGNPPYNANQQNENDNNKNRAYPHIDASIKDSYIRLSTAQKTKAYDMYTRFFRWASDRLHDDGILAFVSNNSFVNARTMDGFRKCLADEFSEVWIVDLKGNARTSGERRRQEGGNIFDDKIRVGVAIYFCVKKRGAHDCRIFYEAVRDYAKSDEKLDFVSAASLPQRSFEKISPDLNSNWINLSENDFEAMIPVASKATKRTKLKSQERAIFRQYSLGIVTNRDEWVLAASDDEIRKKVEYLINSYNSDRSRLAGVSKLKRRESTLDMSIKWTRAVKNDLVNDVKYEFDDEAFQHCEYRPFVRRRVYFSRKLNEMVYQIPSMFGPEAGPNEGICYVAEERASFSALALAQIPNKDFFMPSAGQVLPRLTYSKTGARIDNITDWALKKFIAHYGKNAGTRGKAARELTKDAIFHYVYAVLHDPLYREKYAQNLKREFPRIPFYENFWRWADWGARLMALHIGYETVEPFGLKRIDVADEKSRAAKLSPKVVLRSDHATGVITLDSETQLAGVPKSAWDYRLGNRTALDWILDQHKEKTPKDPTIREKFNTYRFADHKEKVVDLLMRVTRVSVETMEIVEAMRAEPRVAEAAGT